MIFFEKLNDKICNAQKIRSGEISNCLFDIYINSVMTHGKNMFQTTSDMEMSIMCVDHSSPL